MRRAASLINTPPSVKHVLEFEFGKAETILNGKDLTILTYGFLLREALKAAELLEAEGVSIRLLNLRSLKPIDESALLRAAAETGLLVIIEDHFLTGGLFSILCELLTRSRITRDVLPIALENRWLKPALLDEVLDHEGFTAPKLAARILERFKTGQS